MPEEKEIEDPILYNTSERLLRRLKPLNPVTVMVPEPGDSRKYNFHTVQDTTEIEKYCNEMRKNSPDLRVERNKSSVKGLQFASVPPIIIEKVVGMANFLMARGAERKKMMMRIVTEYPEYLTTAKHNIGMV